MGQIKNELGHRYDQLLVLRQATPEERQLYKSRHILWYCQCDCGNTCLVTGTDLRAGKQKSCGCLKKKNTIQRNQQNFRDLTNQKFGKLTVLYPLSQRGSGGNYIWHCQCDCGNTCDVIGSRLTGYHTTSCGCSYTRRKSQYSEKIAKILKENNISYKEEYYISYPDQSYGFLDFFLFDYNIGIEVQGQQHYDDASPWYRPEADQKKKQWCINNNIELIEIPYWDINQYSIDYLKQKIEGK